MWRASLLAIAVLATVLLTPGAAAGAWESPVRISDGVMDARYPQVAAAGQYVHAVWRDVSAMTLVYRRSTDGGSTWADPITLHTAGCTYAYVAVSGQYVHVVWDAESSSIKYRRSTAYGAAGSWDATVTLSSGTTTGYEPDIAARGSRVYVTWIGYSPHQDEILFRSSADNGASWAAATTAATGCTGTARVAASYNSGTAAEMVYVAWYSDDAGNYYVKHQRSTNGGSAWSAALTLWTISKATQNYCEVSVAAHKQHILVDRYTPAPAGPSQRHSADYGATFANSVNLGSGNVFTPEVDVNLGYTDNGCSVYTRSNRLYVSIAAAGETDIGAAGGSSPAADIGTDGNVNMHVVCSSRGASIYDINYHRYVEADDFTPPDGGDLTGVWKSDAAWGDLDGDGDLDLVTSGETAAGTLVTKTYRNQGGALVFSQDLDGVQNESSGHLAFGDYDGDGDLDLALAGATAAGRITRIYRNNGSGTLTWDSAQALTGLQLAALAFGDYDLDGDLDLVTIGHDGAQARALLYRNDPLGTLTLDAAAALVGVYAGSADWADMDRDGDLDLLITGSDGVQRRTIFYENNPPGVLTNDGDHGLPATSLSDAAWGDYDNDGDLDLAITGSGTPNFARIYANDGVGNLSQVKNMANIYRSSCAWGDYDNDGDLDVAICGYDGSGLYTWICQNTGSDFVEQPFYFPYVREGSLSWADADQDGDLDFFVTGADWDTKYARLYMNTGGLSNSPPGVPTTVGCDVVPGGMRLRWNAAADGQTQSAGLYYALRVGRTAGGHEILSGTYGTPLMGNAGQGRSIVLDVPAGDYYWSVRAVDAGLAASAWSPEVACAVSGVAPDGPPAPDLPGGFALAIEDANPFRPPVTVSYRLPAGGPVELGIYDVAGRLVRRLVDDAQGAGPHVVAWDGRDSGGSAVGPGIYLIRLASDGRGETRKAALVR